MENKQIKCPVCESTKFISCKELKYIHCKKCGESLDYNYCKLNFEVVKNAN